MVDSADNSQPFKLQEIRQNFSNIKLIKTLFLHESYKTKRLALIIPTQIKLRIEIMNINIMHE